MSEWNTINSAPKDGSRILLYNQYSNYVCIGHWTDDARIWEGTERPHWIEFECDDWYYSVHLISEDEPTHWRYVDKPDLTK